ncbi:glutamate racemase [Porphyromonas crevioricanis JCM 13913]|nr:glutamate racemase [Porphyromonas crevioricanis JCM 13913]
MLYLWGKIPKQQTTNSQYILQSMNKTPIGIFDSGYGGLTILNEIRKLLPEYDYVYLGDNARSPYGSRSCEVVYKFTKQAVDTLFDLGCPLVILACNTASAKALRTIQQLDLPQSGDPSRRVLGVIRPTVEVIEKLSVGGHVGVLATQGTVSSHSYQIEINKLFPDVKVTEEACPLWVPLVETGESESPGADYFVRKHLEQLIAKDDSIDTIILGCTHYPLLIPKMKRLLTPTIKLVPQGEIVAKSLTDYLERHPEMDKRLSRNGSIRYLTTESCDKFKDLASVFLSDDIKAEHINID